MRNDSDASRIAAMASAGFALSIRSSLDDHNYPKKSFTGAAGDDPRASFSGPIRRGFPAAAVLDEGRFVLAVSSDQSRTAAIIADFSIATTVLLFPPVFVAAVARQRI